MAAKETARLKILFDINGHFGNPDERAAVMRAQEINARLAEDYVKELAQQEVKGYGGRGTRDYPGPMSDHYSASVTADGDLVLTNPTDRAGFFEYGTEPHEIWASGLFARGRATPPRGKTGRFTRGANALAFDFIGGTRFVGVMVDHPGQEANPIAARTLSENLDRFAANIGDELAREVAHG